MEVASSSSAAAAAAGLLPCGHHAHACSVRSAITSGRSAFTCSWLPADFLGRRLLPMAPERAKHLSGRCALPVIRAMDATFGGGESRIFPRINIRDPYKRLGISQDASEEEIREAHKYLLAEYGGHDKSRTSIEAAYDKIIMESFHARRRSRYNLKSNLKKKFAELPPWAQNILTFSMFEVPPRNIILVRAAFFVFLALWSVLSGTEGGPAFQVALSFAGCVYFLHATLKSIWKALLFGFVGLVVGWVFGSCIVPFLPPVFPGTWSLELTSALISYVFLFVTCTFLKK